MIDSSQRVAIVAHDAGGAEILSSYVVQQNLLCSYVLAGPALKIFNRKIGPVRVMPLEDAITQSEWLLCGTSWQSDLEWQAIKMANVHGKRSVAFLDHWVHYRERFVRDGVTCLPNEIWVGDAHAKALAERVIPEVITKLLANPYFDELKREIVAIRRLEIKREVGLNLLFVSEPVREGGARMYGNERYWGYTEEEALHYLLSNLHVLVQPVGRIVIRPHPSELPDKYDWVDKVYKLAIVSAGNRTLLEDIAESDVVVGFQSMAMVIGLLAGKRVISCIPENGNKCVLPQTEIEHLQSLIHEIS